MLLTFLWILYVPNHLKVNDILLILCWYFDLKSEMHSFWVKMQKILTLLAWRIHVRILCWEHDIVLASCSPFLLPKQFWHLLVEFDELFDGGVLDFPNNRQQWHRGKIFEIFWINSCLHVYVFTISRTWKKIKVIKNWFGRLYTRDIWWQSSH